MKAISRRRPPAFQSRSPIYLLPGAVVMLVAGCASVYEAPLVPDPSAAPELYAAPMQAQYLIGVGDELTIRSYYDPSLNQEVFVRPDGRISVVLLGEIMVAGMAPDELRATLKAGYADQLDEPDISVIVTQTADSQIFIGGEVASPTVVPLSGSLTLRQAIASAGGSLTTADLSQVLIMRKGSGGQVTASKVDLATAMKANQPDLFLHRHDLVFLPKSGIAVVGDYVDLYINRLVPRSVLMQFGFITTLNDSTATVTTPIVPGP